MKNTPITRKGAASFYVVIFATLIFSVIIVSFIRLMISESMQNSDSDLSQSAYDAAVAGIEDAKYAIEKCQESGGTGCDKLYIEDNNSSNDDCYGVMRVVSNDNGADAERVISTSADQAYTCVKVKHSLLDYKYNPSRTNGSSRVIPLNANSKTVSVSWLHKKDKDFDNWNLTSGTTELFPTYDNAINPPVISIGAIESGDDSQTSGHVNTIIVHPLANASGKQTPQDAYNIARAHSGANTPAYVTCSKEGSTANRDYACNATFKITDRTFEYLVIDFPYGETGISVDIEQSKVAESSVSSSNRLAFESQVSIDSTGRAGDYYRRVESRVDITTTQTSYSTESYALINIPKNTGPGEDTLSSSEEGIAKNLWYTRNCWAAANGNAQRENAPCKGRDNGTL